MEVIITYHEPISTLDDEDNSVYSRGIFSLIPILTIGGSSHQALTHTIAASGHLLSPWCTMRQEVDKPPASFQFLPLHPQLVVSTTTTAKLCPRQSQSRRPQVPVLTPAAVRGRNEEDKGNRSTSSARLGARGRGLDSGDLSPLSARPRKHPAGGCRHARGNVPRLVSAPHPRSLPNSCSAESDTAAPRGTRTFTSASRASRDSVCPPFPKNFHARSRRPHDTDLMMMMMMDVEMFASETVFKRCR